MTWRCSTENNCRERASVERYFWPAVCGVTRSKDRGSSCCNGSNSLVCSKFSLACKGVNVIEVASVSWVICDDTLDIGEVPCTYCMRGEGREPFLLLHLSSTSDRTIRVIAHLVRVRTCTGCSCRSEASSESEPDIKFFSVSSFGSCERISREALEL